MKTKVVDMGQAKSHFAFSRYRFWHGQSSGKIRRFIRPKSVKGVRERIKPWTRRNNGQSLETVIGRVNVTLRGFYDYFKHVRAAALAELDGWSRGRLRGILRKGEAREDEVKAWTINGGPTTTLQSAGCTAWHKPTPKN